MKENRKRLTLLDGRSAERGKAMDMAVEDRTFSGTHLEYLVQAFIEKGITLAREGNYSDALRILEEDLCFTANPLAMSYYALCLAIVERRYDNAISICLMALGKEFYNPDIYCNLGRIFLLNGQKATAIKAFRRGLAFDSSHPGLIEEIKKLGIRRKPIIPFLPRSNPINKFLGLLAKRLGL